MHKPGRSQDFTFYIGEGAQKLSVEGAERGKDWGRGVPLPNLLGGLWERRELPQRGPGQSTHRPAGCKRILAF